MSIVPLLSAQRGSDQVNAWELGVLSDGGSFVAPSNTDDLYSRLVSLGLINSASLVNSCNGGKADALYNFIPSPVQSLDRFTVTRASTKLRIGSNGLYGSVANNVPAFEFNTDGTYRGLLVEPGATNLVTYSQEFNDASWLKEQGGVSLVPVVTPNTAIAPDGTMTADTVVFDLNGGTTTSDLSQLSSNAITHGATAHTGSVFAKTTDGSTKVFSFLTASGTVTQVSIGADWTRISTTSSLSATATRMRLRLRGGAEATSTSASIHLWQAQYESGSVATSPIVTTAGTASRVADSVTLASASSVIGQTQGTMYLELEPRSTGVDNRGVFEIEIDANNVRRLKMNLAGGIDFRPATGGTGTTLFTSTQSAIATVFRVALAYADLNTAMYYNGVQVGATNTTYVYGAGTYATARLGTGSATPLNGWIRSVALFPTRLANATLASLTA